MVHSTSSQRFRGRVIRHLPSPVPEDSALGAGSSDPTSWRGSGREGLDNPVVSYTALCQGAPASHIVEYVNNEALSLGDFDHQVVIVTG